MLFAVGKYVDIDRYRQSLPNEVYVQMRRQSPQCKAAVVGSRCITRVVRGKTSEHCSRNVEAGIFTRHFVCLRSPLLVEPISACARQPQYQTDPETRPYAMIGQKTGLRIPAATYLDRWCTPGMERHAGLIRLSVREIRSSRSNVHRSASRAYGGEQMPIGVLGVRECRARRAYDNCCIGCGRLQQLRIRADWRFARAQNASQYMTECSRSTRASRRIATTLSALFRGKFCPAFGDAVGLLIAPKDVLRLQFKTNDTAKPDGAISIS